MLDDVIEIIAELLLDGCGEVLGSKEVPLWIRTIAGVILGTVGLVLFVIGVIILEQGIIESDVALIAVGSVLVVICVGAVLILVRKLKKREIH